MRRPRWLRWFQPKPIDLVIAVLLLGLLKSVAERLSSCADCLPSAAQRAEIQLASIAAAIDMHRVDTKQLPATLEALRLNAYQLPEPCLWDVPNDPWGNPYAYTSDGSRYEVRSWGEDGRPRTSDDRVWPKAK